MKVRSKVIFLSDKVEGLANTVQASLAKNGVCMNTDGGSSIGTYKQALASASSDYNSTAYSGTKTNSSNLNLSDSINCINNIGKLPADHSDNVVGITALSDNDLKDFITAHPDVPTAEQKTAGNEKGINYTSQLMAGSGAWMADDGGLKWYEGTGSQAITGYPTGTKDADGNEITLDKMQATDKDGKLLYYTDDTKDLTKTTTDTSKITLGTNTDGTTKTADDYKVYYKPASAANLTAGSAAWVDGSLIKGNGQDNTTLYNNGYVAGMQHQTNGNIVYTLVHQHTGSPTSGGGCYTVKKSSQRQVTETVWEPIPWDDGQGRSGVGVYTTETKTVTDYWYELGCNHKDGDFIRTTSDYNSIQPNERIQKAEITY